MTLPNFIIVGAPKCGTTSLHHYLRQHPEVFVSDVKEPRYFLLETGPDGAETRLDPDFPQKSFHIHVKTMAEYTGLFSEANGQTAVGESSTYYLYSPVALSRIRETMPEARLIFALRNPVGRAYSDYLMHVRQGKEARPIEESLVAGRHYVEYGRYDHYLAGWYDAFDPAQIKVVLFDDLTTQALEVFQDVCRFLEIADDFEPDLTVRMKGGKPKNEALLNLVFKMKRLPGIGSQIKNLPPGVYKSWRGFTEKYLYEESAALPEDIRQALRAYYRDDVAALEERLGRDLSAWK